MIERLLRLGAVAASLIVLASWALFAIDESKAATGRTAREVAGQKAAGVPAPTASQERARERAHSRVRETLDDANDILVSPFASLTDGMQGAWFPRTAAMLLALCIYGFGGGYLARYMRGRATGFRRT